MADEEGGVALSPSVPLGSEVSCTTIRGDSYRGNVIAGYHPSRVLVLKAPVDTTGIATGSKTVRVINLKNASKLEVLSECSTPPAPLPDIDPEKVRRRLQGSIEAKRKEVMSRGVNVSEQAQKLFDYISKMYNDIHWDGSVIVVLKDVHIFPPYGPDNCQGSPLACDRIKKQVTKFRKESSTE